MTKKQKQDTVLIALHENVGRDQQVGLLCRLASRRGLSTEVVSRKEELLDKVRTLNYRGVIADANIQNATGIRDYSATEDLVKTLDDDEPKSKILVISGSDNVVNLRYLGIYACIKTDIPYIMNYFKGL